MEHRAEGIEHREKLFWISKFAIQKTPINLAPQESPLPLEAMSQFAEPVIPDESA